MAATEQRLPYAAAYAVAQRLLDEIYDCCDEAIIAGPIRRGEPTCGVVEILVVPSVELRHERDLFGEVVRTVPNDRLAARLDSLIDHDVIRRRPRADGKLVWGPSWKALTFENTSVDLFTPERARLGWIVALRTGPAAYRRQLVCPVGLTTKDGRSGLLPPTIKPRGGWLTWGGSGERIVTPTEREVFDLFGLAYPDPRTRR